MRTQRLPRTRMLRRRRPDEREDEARAGRVAFDACGTMFGETRCHDETFARMPFFRLCSPRYGAHGQLMITTSTGLPRACTPSSP